MMCLDFFIYKYTHVHHFKKCEDDQNGTVWKMNAFTLKPMFYRTPDPIPLFSNNEKENKYTKMIALQKLGLTT